MIESEEKLEGLTRIITRWAKHTKVYAQLRTPDIPMLAYQILEEFYHVQLSCGHLVESIDEGVRIAFYDYGNEEKVVISGLYCPECAEKYKRNLGAWEVK